MTLCNNLLNSDVYTLFYQKSNAYILINYLISIRVILRQFVGFLNLKSW